MGCVPASEGKGTGASEMNEEEIQCTGSQIRRAALEKHVAAFLRCGGVVQQIPEGATGYHPSGKATPFVINMNAAPPKPHKQVKQNWKEYTHGK